MQLTAESGWNEKQQEEGKHIEAFLAAYEPQATLELFACCPDPPDFLARFSDGRAMHIEHTRIFRDMPGGARPMQEEEARRDRLMSLAQTVYEKSQRPAVIVWPEFQQSFSLEPTQLHETASRIAKLVVSHVPPDGRQVSSTVYPGELPGFHWPVGVAELSIYRFPGQREARWFGHGLEWAGRLSVARLQMLIAKKGDHLHGHSAARSVQEVLVVVLGGSLHSSIIDSEEIFQKEFRSNFDGAFVWLHSAKRWWALRLRPN